jgi:phosphonate metabolism protein PhnN/1,5-bisphosphokinase (PRPP-forming)
MTELPHIPHSERLIVVVGPSGAGKDSVLQAWARLRSLDGPQVHHAQRVITRPADDGAEQHEPISVDHFASLQAAGALATAWQAHGLGYGVRHRAFAPLAGGDWVVLNSSRAHLPCLREQAPRLSVVEITAPAAVRAQRLHGRGREDAAAVAARLQREAPAVQADLTLVNDSSVLEVAQGLQSWWEARQLAP